MSWDVHLVSTEVRTTMQRLHNGFVMGGRYLLGDRLASGGMADVWSGTDTVLQRRVAVKVMRPDAGHETLFALRFRDEALHSAGLLHANIATVFDYGEEGELAYLVMELVDGQPLSAVRRTASIRFGDAARSRHRSAPYN